MTNPPYFPRTKPDKADWIANFSSKLTADPARYGQTAGVATAVAAVALTLATAYAVSIDPATRTSPTVAAANAAFAAAEAEIRPIATEISASLGVTDEAKLDIGVTLRSTNRTPRVAPATAPALVLDSQTPGIANMRWSNPEAPASKAAPLGCSGVEIVGGYALAAGAVPDTLPTLLNPTRNPFVLDTGGHEGKTCRLWARWVSTSGNNGRKTYSAWSPVLTFVVG